MPFNGKSPNASQQQQQQETKLFKSIELAVSTYWSEQTTRVHDIYGTFGYKLVHVGTRATKNPRVTMWRAYIVHPLEASQTDARREAARLVRNTFPVDSELGFWQSDFDIQNCIVVSWFAFDSRPKGK